VEKLDSLRKHLIASVPEIRNSPEKMEIFVDKGDVAARAGSLSFEYSYTASVWVQDYTGDVDDLLVPILAWIGVYQPELFHVGDRKPFTFEAELLDADTCDITISINLTELVRVEQKEKGVKVTHLPEPVMNDAFADVPTGTNLWAGLIEDGTGMVEIVTR
jgi:hypothetical protein